MALLEDLYAQNPGVATPTPSAATATGAETRDATAGTATTNRATATQAQSAGRAKASDVGKTSVGSSGYEALSGTVSPNQLASQQLTNITSQSNPYMTRARQSGILTAASRGLDNSSIAGGMAMGAAADRAAPLAQQDARTHANQSLTNQAAINRAREFTAGASNQAQLAEAGYDAQAKQQTAAQRTSTDQFNVEQENRINQLNAQLGTDISKFNEQQVNQAEALNAQMQTAVSQGNSEAYNRARQQFSELQTQVSLANADQEYKASLASSDMTNQMNTEILRSNSELNRQFLAGSQSMDLATIQGQYQQLISSNETAASLYQSYFNGISQAMANQDITPGRIAEYVGVQQSMLEASLRMMDNMNNLDLGEFELPGATQYGARIIPTPGAGEAVTGEAIDPAQPEQTFSDDQIRDSIGRRLRGDPPEPGDELITEDILQDYYRRNNLPFYQGP